MEGCQGCDGKRGEKQGRTNHWRIRSRGRMGKERHREREVCALCVTW